MKTPVKPKQTKPKPKQTKTEFQKDSANYVKASMYQDTSFAKTWASRKPDPSSPYKAKATFDTSNKKRQADSTMQAVGSKYSAKNNPNAPKNSMGLTKQGESLRAAAEKQSDKFDKSKYAKALIKKGNNLGRPTPTKKPKPKK
jgi:hypothetical protein